MPSPSPRRSRHEVPVRAIAIAIGMVLLTGLSLLFIYEVRRILVWLVVLAFFISRGVIKTGLGRRVALVFMRVLGFNKEKATRHMREVHERGRSLVASETRERAELYHQQIQSHGLIVTLEQSS